MGFFDRFRGRAPQSQVGGPVPLPPPPSAPGSAPCVAPALDGSWLASAVGGADRVVVVDCETTGVYRSDRIVELALVTVDLDGQVVERWDTLVHPDRDPGPTHIHGLTAEALQDAPAFADIAGDVAVRLHGACLAAHNLPFDSRMLVGEFDRLGYDLAFVAGLDTLAATKCKLHVACQQHRIPLEGAHAALVDATATLKMLRDIGWFADPHTLPRRTKEAVLQALLDASAAHHGACVGIVVPQRRAAAIKNLVSARERWSDHRNPRRKVVHTGDFSALSRRHRLELLSMDGATLLDRGGSVLAAGAILKVSPGSTGGGRTAAAKMLGRYGVGMKVSQDGPVVAYSGKGGQEIFRLG